MARSYTHARMHIYVHKQTLYIYPVTRHKHKSSLYILNLVNLLFWPKASRTDKNMAKVQILCTLRGFCVKYKECVSILHRSTCDSVKERRAQVSVV